MNRKAPWTTMHPKSAVAAETQAERTHTIFVPPTRSSKTFCKIRRVSKRMSIRLKEYSQLRKKWLEILLIQNGGTMIPCGVCTKPLQILDVDTHHRKGRGKYLLDITTWMPVCRQCHQRIDANRAWAYEHGYLLKRGK